MYLKINSSQILILLQRMRPQHRSFPVNFVTFLRTPFYNSGRLLLEKTENIINSIAEEIRELNKKFRQMESDIATVKNVNRVFSKQVFSTERERWKMPNTLEEIVLRCWEYLPQLTTKNQKKLSARFKSILASI